MQNYFPVSLINVIHTSDRPVTCFYQGQIYQEGDIWVDNPAHPCNWFTCRRNGVAQLNSTFCPPLIPRDCPRERDPGQCCYSCQNGQLAEANTSSAKFK